MLLPEQVIPFLAHEDEILRDHAAYYFDRAHGPSPLTADTLWAAIDEIPASASAGGLIRLLPDVPVSDASTDRLLAAFEEERHIDAQDDLLDALQRLPLDQARRALDRIRAMPEMPEIPDDVRSNLAQRLA